MLGLHIHKGKYKTFETAINSALTNATEKYKIAFNTIQIFVVGPRSHNTIIKDNDISTLKNYIKTNKLTTYVHGAYIDNPWDLIETTGAVDIMKNIINELKICDIMDFEGVIIHGSKSVKKNLKAVISYISANYKTTKTLYLEMVAMLPSDNSLETPDKVNELFDMIRKLKSKIRIGFVVDTAHLAAMGIALTSYNSAKNWFSALNAQDIPLIIHLNDYGGIVGSGIDLHASLGKNIWSGVTDELTFKKSGLYYIVAFAKKNKIPLIIERDSEALNDDFKFIQKYF